MIRYVFPEKDYDSSFYTHHFVNWRLENRANAETGFFLKGQLAKWKFTFDILVTVNMGQNITIHPRISSGAPSVRALELKQN